MIKTLNGILCALCLTCVCFFNLFNKSRLDIGIKIPTLVLDTVLFCVGYLLWCFLRKKESRQKILTQLPLVTIVSYKVTRIALIWNQYIVLRLNYAMENITNVQSRKGVTDIFYAAILETVSILVVVLLVIYMMIFKNKLKKRKYLVGVFGISVLMLTFCFVELLVQRNQMNNIRSVFIQNFGMIYGMVIPILLLVCNAVRNYEEVKKDEK